MIFPWLGEEKKKETFISKALSFCLPMLSLVIGLTKTEGKKKF